MRNPSWRLPISLVIPAYNAEAHIRAALESVTSQSVMPAEIIVVDDASPDRISDVATEYGARVIRFPVNAGPAAARNAGAFAASQPWVAFLDADDVWLGDKLQAQWAAIESWPDVGFCFTDYDVVDAGAMRSREMASDEGYAAMRPSERRGTALRFECDALADGLARSMFIRQSSVIVRRALFLRLGGYDEALRLSEDYEFFLRLITAAPAVAIERSLVTYQRRSTSLSVDPLAEIASIERLWAAILEHPARYPSAVVDQIEQRRPETLLRGCGIALRLGRFPEAIPFAQRAFASDASAESLLLLCLSVLLDNGPGRAAFHAVRSAWRSRPQAGSMSAGRQLLERALHLSR
jgi:GT2 family glycosyltransferase